MSAALARAETYCDAHGLKFTATRRHVFELLLKNHRAIGAYDILDSLRQAGLGGQPPVVYRALEFLTKHGFAHKIERKNAFIACHNPTPAPSGVFFICASCGTVAETVMNALHRGVERAAAEIGFTPKTATLEIEGICPTCRDSGSA
jgi:Fur family zinc uptake transcriptional regulator